MSFTIEKREYVFNEPMQRSSRNKAVFPFVGDANEIEKMTSSCGCTDPKVEGNSIVIYYNAPSNSTQVVQKATIWLRDGKPLEVKNPVNGQMIKNVDKSHIELIIKGTVV